MKKSFKFQSFVQLTATESAIAKYTRPVRVIERSLFSSFNCFATNLYQTKVAFCSFL